MKIGEDFIVNDALKRAALIEPFGVALYELADPTEEGDVVGTHLGVVETTEEAEKWVQGGRFPRQAIRIWAT